MKVFKTVSDLRAFLASHREKNHSVGFVPTMGAFHEGHLTLMRQSKAECGLCVVSLFVNPTQFGPGEDLSRYPRDFERDASLAESAGVDALFAPDVQEIYPSGPAVTVEVADLSARWEGQRRPHHFTGVATVCTRLFSIVQPDLSYFGMKDYQQLKIIQRLVHALHFPTAIVPVPTVREADGLAMSSRNTYLNEKERASAPTIYEALGASRARFRGGERSSEALAGTARRFFVQRPLITEDYITVVDPESLEPIPSIQNRAVMLIAARVGGIRLIDNILLDSRESA